MNKLAKKIKVNIVTHKSQENSELKSEFIQRIIKARNLSEDLVINLLCALEGTHSEGLHLMALKERIRNTISSGGGKKKAEQSRAIDKFAKCKYLEHSEKFSHYSSAHLARYLIKTYGADRVGAVGPLRRKISQWKKETT